jgi:hypothetical protein
MYSISHFILQILSNSVLNGLRTLNL